MDHKILCGRVESWPINTDKHAKLKQWLTELKEVARETNEEMASLLGIPTSKQLTLVKPSGTVSQLTGTSSGIHPRYAAYYSRRYIQDTGDPLTQLMIDQGVPYVERGEKRVFAFPIKAPEGSITSRSIGALSQLELWKIYRQHWCEGNPSQTIYYTDDEFLEVQAWIWKNWDIIGGLSFFPLDDTVYDKEAQPYLELTKEQYEKARDAFPEKIQWNLLSQYELQDETQREQEFACSGGQCEL